MHDFCFFAISNSWNRPDYLESARNKLESRVNMKLRLFWVLNKTTSQCQTYLNRTISISINKNISKSWRCSIDIFSFGESCDNCFAFGWILFISWIPFKIISMGKTEAKWKKKRRISNKINGNHKIGSKKEAQKV